MNARSKYDTDFEKAGSKLSNLETEVSTIDIRGTSLKDRQFCPTRFPSGGMMHAQKCFNPWATNVIYIYGAPILDVSRSHTTTQHSR